MTPRLLVLGTDTDAGKTTFSLLWLAAFSGQCDYWKPVETGDSDTERVRSLVPSAVVHAPMAQFRDAVAPPLAARREGRSCPTAAEIVASVPGTPRGLLIESFGSPFSPLNETELQIELVRQLGVPCVLVSSSKLGAVGRTVQAFDALAGAGLVPLAVVLMGKRDEYAIEEITKHRGVKVVALTPPRKWDVAGIALATSQQRDALHTLRDLLSPSPLGGKGWGGGYATASRNESEVSGKLTPHPGSPPQGGREKEGLLGTSVVSEDRRFIWHPYTSLQANDPLPVVAAEAEFLQLADGSRLIDAVSSWWTILHGHRHPPLMAALREASQHIDHVLFAGVTHPYAVRFAELILRTAPWPNGRVFFSDNGSTAVEVALKMAYQFWCHRGEPQRKLFIGFEHAYHGDTFGAMSVSRDRLFFAPFEPLLFEAVQLPLDPTRLDEFLQQRAREVAAIIVEPLIQGAGGMRMHSPETLRELFDVAKSHGVLFIADEVMTGNRTGRRWAFQHANIAPDLICAAKTLAGGILPLAVTLAGPNIVAAFDTADRTKTFFHGHSFTAHPLACAVAAVNEHLISQPGVLERATEIGQFFERELAPLREHPQVADVRIFGSIAAVEVRADGGYLATEAERWKAIALERGVFLRPLGNVLYAMPPLGTSADSLARIADAIRSAILS